LFLLWFSASDTASCPVVSQHADDILILLVSVLLLVHGVAPAHLEQSNRLDDVSGASKQKISKGRETARKQEQKDGGGGAKKTGYKMKWSSKEVGGLAEERAGKC